MRKPRDIALFSVRTADGRRRPVQTYRRLRAQLIEDQGGHENLSAAALVAIETLSQAAALQREEFSDYVSKPGTDPARFIALSNLLLGSVRTVGMARVPRDVSLAAYLERTEGDSDGA